MNNKFEEIEKLTKILTSLVIFIVIVSIFSVIYFGFIDASLIKGTKNLNERQNIETVEPQNSNEPF